jgi:hypothetical protein
MGHYSASLSQLDVLFAGYFLRNWIPELDTKYPSFIGTMQQDKSMENETHKLTPLY